MRVGKPTVTAPFEKAGQQLVLVLSSCVQKQCCTVLVHGVVGRKGRGQPCSSVCMADSGLRCGH